MGREVDRRDFTVNRLSAARENQLHGLASEVSDRLPGDHRISIAGFNPVTGNPALVASEAAPDEKGNYVQRALDHVRGISRALGLVATQPVEFTADPNTSQASSGSVTVHLQQQYKGISIFQANEAVRFSPSGHLDETVGSSISVVDELDLSPKLSVQEAVLKAAQHVAVPQADEQGAKDPFGESLKLTSVDVSHFQPKVIATFPDKADQPTVLEAGPFGDRLKANLIWFPLADTLRLAWETIVTMPNYEGQYRTIVDSETGEILYCHQLIKRVAARGNVYVVDGSSPRQPINFPRPLTDYGFPLPNPMPSEFPDDWVTDNRSVGNSTFAHLGQSGPTIAGTTQNGVLTFDPSDAVGDDQKVLNIFYYNCYMHDFFYLLGFRELDGNFQRDNLARGGRTLDPVDARAHSGEVSGTANMSTPIDGSSPVMNMGLVTATGRHTAFDSSVVFHEFMHGVTNRLVGGPLDTRALDAPQSEGMGEGWGDYIACAINNTEVVGSWVVNQPLGIREFRYDSSFPDDFGNLGKGRYNEEHNIGEIWCATLMEVNRKIGKTLAVQLVVDALKVSPANPSFLDMRDAILKTLDNKLAAGQLTAGEHGNARNGIWTAFAKFGMGPAARSNGASLTGIVPDFNKPPEPTGSSSHVESSPNVVIPDNQPAGVTSVVNFSQAGIIKRLSVSVDIVHTFIGDLQVSLIAPSGDPIVLHNREGASADDLIKSYTSEGTAGLAALAGKSAQGNWTLKVADLAGADVGTLRRWSLDIGVEAGPQSARGEAAPGAMIPDNNPSGISSTIGVTAPGIATGIKVAIDITHTFIGDLKVELISPSGQSAVLHDRRGGGQDNLIVTFDSTSTSALVPLINQPVAGNWVLRVSDLAALDTGKLNKWSLELTVGG